MWGMALPVRLDHCVIHVSDWEVSNAFYRDVVGAELVQRDGRTGSPVRVSVPVAMYPLEDIAMAWDHGSGERAVVTFGPLSADGDRRGVSAGS